MTLGELIKQYMTDHALTYEHFAKTCDLSKGYISMLVNNMNPRTGKPPVPKVHTYMRIASAMGISLDDLFRQIDDSPVAVGGFGEPEEGYMAQSIEARIISGGVDKLPQEDRERILAVVRAMYQNSPDLFPTIRKDEADD